MCRRSAVVHAVRTLSHHSSPRTPHSSAPTSDTRTITSGAPKYVAASSLAAAVTTTPLPPLFSARTKSRFIAFMSTPWLRSISSTVSPLASAPVSLKCAHVSAADGWHQPPASTHSSR